MLGIRLFMVCGLMLFLVGCSTTVSCVELERSDQDLSGNQGYLMGTVPPDYERTEQKPWQLIEFEVEFKALRKPGDKKSQ